MNFKSILCLLLLAVTTARGIDDEWSWGVEDKEASVSSSSHSVLEEAPVREGHSLLKESSVLDIDTLPLSDEPEPIFHEVLPLETEDQSFGHKSLPLTSEPLPLEPHGTASFSVAGEGDIVDGLVVAEGGDREGRFLGLGEAMCSLGIGLNCDKKAPGYNGPPKRLSTQGVYGPPNPIKTHYGAPKPLVPKGTYGPPQSLPPPPVLPNRNYNAQAPTKAPFSPLNGLFSVLKPLLPSSKPAAPPKVSKGGILSPSYTAPNPNYAPLLPSYTPPNKPAYSAPTPHYVTQPVYSPPKPAYVAPQPTYVSPKPVYAPPKPSYDVVQPSYTTPKPSYDVVQPSYNAPKPAYIKPKPVYVNAVPTVTVQAQPTLVEQHHHTHTHVYNDKTVHEGIYKHDYNGQLQSVHDSINQVNQHVIHRQDISDDSSHDSHVTVHVAQPSINHVVHQQLPATSPPKISIVPAVLTGGTNFRPGRIESGFQPMQKVQEPLFRPLQPAYREDCQCVPVSFCSNQDVIARNLPADISNVIDARTRGSDILSNATDSDEITDDSPVLEELNGQSSVRQARVLDHSANTEVNEVPTEAVNEEEATEAVTEEDTTEAAIEAATEIASVEVTEAVTEAWAEDVENTSEVEEPIISRQRRDTNNTSEETEDPEILYSDRQGRQLTGFTPSSSGCGPNHVCCRRPVFQPRRQQYSCGRRNAAGLLGRVKTAHFVQGDTEFGEYPWQAAILKRENGNMMYLCGGTLIDDKHILTAAHCVDGVHPTDLKVRLGEWDVSGQTEFYDHVEVRSAGVYLHPEFYAGNLNNDIAVVRLEKFVDFSASPHITPVCLPDQSSDFTHHRCHATGWGKDAFGSSGKFSHVLKEVEIPVMDNSQCLQSLRGTRLGANFNLHEGNLCAGGEEGRDTCKGDGGGPLVCSGSDGSIQLAGLVSWGIGCGHPGVPGVYVKVSHYLNWIREITRI